MRLINFCLMTFLTLAPVGQTWAGEDEVREAARRGDYVTAFRELVPLAQTGSADAMYALGHLYARGLGVKQDDQKAVEWYRKAAEQGQLGAMMTMGFMYQDGRGVEKDEVEGFKWILRSAEQGYAIAQYNLAYAYQTGLGVTKDEVAAIKWYRAAAELADAPAMNALGLAYKKGLGVQQDPVEAARWFRMGADRGDWRSQAHLALFYEKGEGVPKDMIEAYVWIHIALREARKDEAWMIAKRISSYLTSEQKTEAIQRVERWRPITDQSKYTSSLDFIVRQNLSSDRTFPSTK